MVIYVYKIKNKKMHFHLGLAGKDCASLLLESFYLFIPLWKMFFAFIYFFLFFFVYTCFKGYLFVCQIFITIWFFVVKCKCMQHVHVQVYIVLSIA